MKRIVLAIGAMVSLALGLSAQGGAPAAPGAGGRRGGGPPSAAGGPQRLSLADRIAHYDPARRNPSPAVHGGPGKLDYFAMFNGNAVDTNLWFLHRGTIDPHSGIGAHFHNYCEEMFVIFDGEAQYTIDGRTALLKGPAGAPARMGHSHAIYNATDKPVEWMNINVTAFKGIYDAFDLRDGRVGAPLDPVSPTANAYSIGITVDGDNRTNLGCFNTSFSTNVISADLYDSANRLVTTIALTVGGGSWTQVGLPNSVSGGYIRWRPVSAAYCYAVVVNNTSNDGTFIPAVNYVP